jgi:hypothetical protein
MMALSASGLIAGAKNVALGLTSAAGLAYACGYLVVRSRANALGTDPGFTLLDQAYVFAGFRFALFTAVTLLLIAPILLLARVVVERLTSAMRPAYLRCLAWIAAVGLAALTLASFRTLGVQAVLLAGPSAARDGLDGALASAVIGSGALGVLIALATTFTAAVTTLWASAWYAKSDAGDPLGLVVTLIAALQLVLLPVQHGIFFADRKARLLERVPDGVVGVVQPVWLIDRGTGKASLLARTTAGTFGLVTIAVEKLDGIAITKVVSIADVIGGRESP